MFLTGLFAFLMSLAVAHAGAPDMYEQLMSDSRLDITIALGFSEVDGHNAPGPSPIPILGPALNALQAHSEDRDNRISDVAAVERALLSCESCGFHKTASAPGYRAYHATILRNGHPVDVNVSFIHPDDGVSATTLKSWFRRAAAKDDVVIYAGHSRKGAGFPDFGPNSVTSGKVFYRQPGGSDWVGFDKTRFNPDKFQIFSMISCQSRHYYEHLLRTRLEGKNASNLDLFLTNQDSYWDDYPAASVALVRGLMRQEPRSQILSELEEAAVEYQTRRLVDSRLPTNLFYASGDVDASPIAAPQIDGEAIAAKQAVPSLAANPAVSGGENISPAQ